MKRSFFGLLPLLVAGAASCGLPDLPGKTEFETACGICHPLSTPLSRRQDREGWERTVWAMRARGAKLSDEEAARVVDFLSKVRKPE